MIKIKVIKMISLVINVLIAIILAANPIKGGSPPRDIKDKDTKILFALEIFNEEIWTKLLMFSFMKG